MGKIRRRGMENGGRLVEEGVGVINGDQTWVVNTQYGDTVL